MRYRLLAGLCVIGFSLGSDILWNAQSMQATQEIMPTPVSTVDLRVFPGDLVCDGREDSPSNDAPSWMGITIGESTLEDVEALLSTLSNDYIFIDDDDRDTRFTNFELLSFDNVDDIPSTVSICLDGNIIQVLSIRYTNYPGYRLYLDDFVSYLGVPDAVTWSNSPTGRVVFWFEQGIAVEVSAVPNEPGYYPTYGRVGTEVYFPYQEVAGYEDRWPYNQTRKFNPYLPLPQEIGASEAALDFGPENPFDFDAMIATITAQPSRTPTSTATATGISTAREGFMP